MFFSGVKLHNQPAICQFPNVAKVFLSVVTVFHLEKEC